MPPSCCGPTGAAKLTAGPVEAGEGRKSAFIVDMAALDVISNKPYKGTYTKKVHGRDSTPKEDAEMKPEYLDQLIDRASKAAGSDYRLAQMLETSRQSVSDWRHGRKACPAGDQALMAQIAGLDAEAWTARAVIAQYEGTPKGELLKQALKKALVATGVTIVSSGASAATFFSEPVSYLIRCIFGQKAAFSGKY